MYPVIDKIFGTEPYTHHHYHEGHWEASIRKRSRKQCRINHHQDMKCFCLCVSFTAVRVLVLRSGFSIYCVFFSQFILAKDHCLHSSTFFAQKNLFNIVNMFFFTNTSHTPEWNSSIHFCLHTYYVASHFWQNISRD